MASSLGLLGRSGVAVLLGIDGRPRDVAVDGRVLGVDVILGNRALIGSVNARADDWRAAVAAPRRRLGPVRRRRGAVRRPARRRPTASPTRSPIAASRPRCVRLKANCLTLVR